MKLSYHTKAPQSNPSASAQCRHCGAVDGFALRETGPHLGRYCLSCGGWIKWISRADAGRYSTSPAGSSGDPTAPTQPQLFEHIWGPPPAPATPPKFTPRQLAHPRNLDERLAAIERDLSVLAQVILGVPDGR